MGQSSVKGARVPCDLGCGADFSRETDMFRHVEEVHGGDVYRCSQQNCRFQGTTRPGHYRKHMAEQNSELDDCKVSQLR